MEPWYEMLLVYNVQCYKNFNYIPEELAMFLNVFVKNELNKFYFKFYKFEAY